MINKRDNCRLCGSKTIDLVLKMPSSPPVDNFRKLEESELLLPWFPMDLYLCGTCHHAQLLDVVSPDILYGNYIYTSSSSPDLDRHFSSYASHVSQKLNLPKGAKVADVGSNDGLLLQKFKSLGFQVLGIEPSHYCANIAIEKGIQTEIGFLKADFAANVKKNHGQMDLITANNVFSHADDLREFAVCARSLLKKGGTFVYEVSYLKDMIDNFVVDYIYHEHLCHHSILPLKKFMESCDLKLIDVERIKTKGGSIRCFAVKSTDPRQPSPTVDQMIQEEKESGLYNLSTYQLMEKKVETIRTELVSFLKQEIAAGKKIAAYGASATSTVLNSLLGIADLISFIIDDNPKRQGRFSPGHLIPILPSDALKQYKPSCIVISAWRFADEIMKRNHQYKLDGGRFVIPFPSLKVE